MRDTVFDQKRIQEILPHRYPFLLVDRIVEFEENKRIVGLKNVSCNENFFPGHFPGVPVMPGVLILEAMAQVSGVLAYVSENGPPEGSRLFIVAADDVKWKKPVTPGDTMLIEMQLEKVRRPFWMMAGKVTVDGVLVAQGRITAAEVD